MIQSTISAVWRETGREEAWEAGDNSGVLAEDNGGRQPGGDRARPGGDDHVRPGSDRTRPSAVRS